MTSGVRRALAGALTLLWVLFGVAAASPAAAHAELVSASPENGAELKAAPTAVRLEFSEPVRPVRKTFVLTDDAGDALSIVQPTGTSRTVVTALPAELGPGFYTFSFRVISVDNHPIKSSVAFFVTAKAKPEKAAGHAGHQAAAPPPSGTPPTTAALGDDGSGAATALAGTARWVAYLGAILLVGLAAFVALCWPAGAVDRRVRSGVLLGAALVVLAALAALPLQAATVAGTGVGGAFSDGQFGDVLDSRYGETMLWRIGFAVALVALLTRWVQRPSPWIAGGAAAATLGLLFSYARAGHPAAGEYPALTMTVDAVHLGAVALWVGGLLVLAARLLPSPPADCAQVLRRWSTVATAAVAALVVAGTIQAARELRSFSALVDSEYGRWILTKSVLLIGMLALANLGRVRVRRWVATPMPIPAGASLGARLADPPVHPEAGRLRRSIGAELVLAAVVLVCTAFLTATSPPHSGHAEHAVAASDTR